MVKLVRGMRDVMPVEARRFAAVDGAICQVLRGYAFEEVHLPLLEFTELFSRGVGEATDIVEKEMYSLNDRDGDSLTLRPEGTASCVRALLQQGLLFNQTQKVFYRGPMFRYEKPQKGRYRQFQQIGAEAFGFAGPDVDAELILMGHDFWQALGVGGAVRLELNTLGSGGSRQAYRDALVEYLRRFEDDLDEDSRRRLTTNPLRVLDSKNERTREIVTGAPQLPDFVDKESRAHFDGLRALLDSLQVPYTVNTRLVRGLDYYTHTVFEWITDELGSQGTICAGGRYDSLVELLGGRPTPGAGFAVGVDRVVLLHEAQGMREFLAGADVYCCVMDAAHSGWALMMCNELRRSRPDLRVRLHTGGGKLKSQLKKADAIGATYALIVGETEVAANQVALKFLRDHTRGQITVAISRLAEQLGTAGMSPDGEGARVGAED